MELKGHGSETDFSLFVSVQAKVPNTSGKDTAFLALSWKSTPRIGGRDELGRLPWVTLFLNYLVQYNTPLTPDLFFPEQSF